MLPGEEVYRTAAGLFEDEVQDFFCLDDFLVDTVEERLGNAEGVVEVADPDRAAEGSSAVLTQSSYPPEEGTEHHVPRELLESRDNEERDDAAKRRHPSVEQNEAEVERCGG